MKTQQWQIVEMIHFLEHLYLWDARAQLRQIRAVLVPGGKLVVEVPNIGYAACVLCGLEQPPRGAAGQFDMWPLYGDPSHQNPLFGHRWGYTPESLVEELVGAGFARDPIRVFGACIIFPRGIFESKPLSLLEITVGQQSPLCSSTRSTLECC